MKSYHKEVWTCAIIATFIVFSYTFAFAQMENIKGVQFKDGSIIYGRIIEMNANNIRIEMKDGVMVSRKFDDVVKFIEDYGVGYKQEAKQMPESEKNLQTESGAPAITGMSTGTKIAIVAAAVAVAGGVAAIAGGGGGDGDDSTSTPTPSTICNVTGTWRGTGYTNITGTASTMLILSQSGNSVSGTWDGLAVTGTVSGNQLTLTMKPFTKDGIYYNGGGTATVTGNSMSGTIWMTGRKLDITITINGTFNATRSSSNAMYGADHVPASGFVAAVIDAIAN